MAPLMNASEFRLERFRASNEFRNSVRVPERWRANRRHFLTGLGALMCGEALLPKRARAFGLLFSGGSTTAGLTGTLFNVQDVAYGAKGNTIQVPDAAITSGTANLSSTQGGFTGRSGQTVCVVGAGSAGAALITTISSVTDNNHAVLAANASTTVSGVLAYVGTDDTSAIQGAINAATTAGGGIVFFPSGGYMVAGALGGPNSQNAQLYIPFIDQTTTPPTKEISLALVGPMYNPPSYYVNGSTIAPPTTGAWLFSAISPATPGTSPACIGTGQENGIFPGNFSGINVNVTGLTIRTLFGPNTAVNALNLNAAYAMTAEGVICDIAQTATQLLAGALPTLGSGYGIRTPAVNNGAKTTLIDCTVMGKNIGFDVCEHGNLFDCDTYFCSDAYRFNSAPHPMYCGQIRAQHCVQNIVGVGAAQIRVKISEFATEHANDATWTLTTADVADSGNALYGTCNYAVVKAGVGQDSTWTKSGGINFTTNAPGSWT